MRQKEIKREEVQLEDVVAEQHHTSQKEEQETRTLPGLSLYYTYTILPVL
jgi:hypothetical protein